MTEPLIKYDEPSDTLYLSFVPGKSATGIELNENILLRIDKQERVAVGLTLFNYSMLSQLTEIGPRSFPLDGLKALSTELRDTVLSILQTAPVHDFLLVSTFTPAVNDEIPITMLRSEQLTARAA